MFAFNRNRFPNAIMNPLLSNQIRYRLGLSRAPSAEPIVKTVRLKRRSGVLSDRRNGEIPRRLSTQSALRYRVSTRARADFTVKFGFRDIGDGRTTGWSGRDGANERGTRPTTGNNRRTASRRGFLRLQTSEIAGSRVCVRGISTPRA